MQNSQSLWTTDLPVTSWALYQLSFRGLDEKGCNEILYIFSPDIFRTLFRTFFGYYSGHFPDIIFRTFFGHFSDIFRTFSGYFSDIFRIFSGHFWGRPTSPPIRPQFAPNSVLMCSSGLLFFPWLKFLRFLIFILTMVITMRKALLIFFY